MCSKTVFTQVADIENLDLVLKMRVIIYFGGPYIINLLISASLEEIKIFCLTLNMKFEVDLLFQQNFALNEMHKLSEIHTHTKGLGIERKIKINNHFTDILFVECHSQYFLIVTVYVVWLVALLKVLKKLNSELTTFSSFFSALRALLSLVVYIVSSTHKYYYLS